jgi:hypothetical protein
MTLIWNITYHELDTSWNGHGSTESWKEKLGAGSWYYGRPAARSCIVELKLDFSLKSCYNKMG